MRVFVKNKVETEETEIRETKKITPLQLFQNDELILEKIELLQQKIEVTNVEKKSEDTLIQITKDSSYKQRYLKKIIAVLLIAVGVCVIAFGIIVCNKLRQPQNYIEAVDPDSVEMKTAELLV